MSSSSSDFTLYAKAERQLCDAAAPILGDLIRKIEAEVGVCITEVRVTMQRPAQDGKPMMANCTIVSAETLQDAAQAASTGPRDTNMTKARGEGVAATTE
jgi:hypothetical protein